MTTLESAIEENAYNVLQDTQPKLLGTVREQLQKGQAPRQIARRVERQDVFLAGIVEMAAVHIRKSGLQP